MVPLERVKREALAEVALAIAGVRLNGILGVAQRLRQAAKLHVRERAVRVEDRTELAVQWRKLDALRVENRGLCIVGLREGLVAPHLLELRRPLVSLQAVAIAEALRLLDLLPRQGHVALRTEDLLSDEAAVLPMGDELMLFLGPLVHLAGAEFDVVHVVAVLVRAAALGEDVNGRRRDSSMEDLVLLVVEYVLLVVHVEVLAQVDLENALRRLDDDLAAGAVRDLNVLRDGDRPDLEGAVLAVLDEDLDEAHVEAGGDPVGRVLAVLEVHHALGAEQRLVDHMLCAVVVLADDGLGGRLAHLLVVPELLGCLKCLALLHVFLLGLALRGALVDAELAGGLFSELLILLFGLLDGFCGELVPLGVVVGALGGELGRVWRAALLLLLLCHGCCYFHCCCCCLARPVLWAVQARVRVHGAPPGERLPAAVGLICRCCCRCRCRNRCRCRCRCCCCC
mmetsp:Transcript_18549/g.59198  ORF Transcript_18549/g.59198 Transcript_18549/m.59198 type:complete len:454 (+) Transcript_18549:1202-2563(+)